MHILKLILVFFIIYFIFYYQNKQILFNFKNLNNDNTQYNLPSGNWREKCDLINWNYPYLWLRCYDDLMHPHNSSIDITNCCEKSIHVHNGHVDCH